MRIVYFHVNLCPINHIITEDSNDMKVEFSDEDLIEGSIYVQDFPFIIVTIVLD